MTLKALPSSPSTSSTHTSLCLILCSTDRSFKIGAKFNHESWMTLKRRTPNCTNGVQTDVACMRVILTTPETNVPSNHACLAQTHDQSTCTLHNTFLTGNSTQLWRVYSKSIFRGGVVFFSDRSHLAKCLSALCEHAVENEKQQESRLHFVYCTITFLDKTIHIFISESIFQVKVGDCIQRSLALQRGKRDNFVWANGHQC